MFTKMFKKQDFEPFLKLSQAESVEPPVRMEAANVATPRFAPGTEISYHPDLISRFHAHHASLQQVFGSIKTHATNGEFAEAQKSLLAFRRTLTAHLLEENIKLYTYLTKCLANDPDNRSLMASMRAEMGEIGNVVLRFLNEYANSGITPFNKDQFLNELDEIGVTLLDRIEREEASLYALYMPPEAFH